MVVGGYIERKRSERTIETLTMRDDNINCKQKKLTTKKLPILDGINGGGGKSLANRTRLKTVLEDLPITLPNNSKILRRGSYRKQVLSDQL